MKKITLCLLLLLTSLSNAQSQFGMKLDVGISQIDNTLISHLNSIEPINIKGITSPSLNIGVYQKYSINSNSIFGIEFLYSLIQDKEIYEMLDKNIYGINGEYLGINDIKLTATNKLEYFSFPIYYGYNLNRFIFKLGIQGAIILNYKSELITEENIDPLLERSEFNNEINIYNTKVSKFDFGLKLGVNYKFNNSISLNLDYYHGLKDISESTYTDSNDFSLTNKQLTMGIEYNLKKL